MAKVMDELDFLIEHKEREKAFHAAKAKADKDPEAWRAEKDRMRAWRQEWREVRAAFAVEPAEGDGDATPDTVGLKAKGN